MTDTQTHDDARPDAPPADGPEAPPELFDENTPDGDDDLSGVEVDFIPMPELTPGEAPSEASVDEFQQESLRAREAFEEARSFSAEGHQEEAITRFIRAAKIAETAREWHMAAVACKQVGDFLVDPAPPYDLERAFRMYRRAIASYEACGLFAEARELAYRQMSIKMRRAGELKLPYAHRAALWLEWATAGFGYRPLRVIGANIIVILFYASLYWFSGGVRRTIALTPGALDPTVHFWNHVYFSGVTFLTIGYGDFVPERHTRLLAMSEGFVGAFMMGFFVAVLANRLSKS